MLDFDIGDFIKSLKGQNAPYQCPSCEKTYKTVSKSLKLLNCSAFSISCK